MWICVYGASSNAIDPAYLQAGERLGEAMAMRGHGLVFGGGQKGMMGAVARGMTRGNGEIIGVAPRFFDVEGVLYPACTKFIFTDTMRERKAIMEERADAFIMTPGGIGTFEEFFEILTLKQLCRHNKPIVLYNLKGYYNELNQVMEESIKKNFIRDNCRELYQITDDLEQLFAYVEAPTDQIRTVKELKDG